MDGAHRQGRRRHGALPYRGGRHPSDTNMPPFKGLEKFQRQMVPHQPVPARRHRLHRQARGRSRYRRDGGAGDPGNLAAGEAAHRLSAHRQLLRAGAQRQGGPRTGQGAQGRLRRHHQTASASRSSGTSITAFQSRCSTLPPKNASASSTGCGIRADSPSVWPITRTWSSSQEANDRLRRLPEAQDPQRRSRTRSSPKSSSRRATLSAPSAQPLDTNYFETFNKDNVLLVDAASDGGIEEITENGHPRRWQGIRVRHHRVRYRVRRADRPA